MKTLIIIISLAITVTAVQAGEALLQLSLTPDIAIHPKTTQINGLALNIWGENPQHSLNLGIVNGSTGDSMGLSWAFIANYADSYTGVQWAFVNVSQRNFLGWQSGAVNFSQGTFTGLQSGWINVAQEFHGLQLGFINYAEKLNGVQVGAVNVAMNNPWFKEFPNKLATGFPFVNWSF
ncbi:MAG: hypothetical protein NTZ16_05800 [Verrucomicrobia bacterium]|nr:hypothetical protein [Verrucomicrobiota bacterium]